MNKVFLNVRTKDSSIEIDLPIPDECPICHAKIYPKCLSSYREDALFAQDRKDWISSIFACPSCHSLFYAKYKYESEGMVRGYELANYGPQHPQITSFGDEVKKTSPNFVEIYNQSEAAEAYKLNQIAGVGYRKALEFLIKDYACHMHPEQEELIKESFLKDCINKYIDHQKIKDLATVATWLGNDETHYQRKWSDLDVQDLKRFIRSCVAWIQADIDAADSANIIASR